MFNLHTESTYSQPPYSDKQQCREMARIHNHSTISNQKRYPTKTDTRQHLKQFYLVGQAPPTDIYTKAKEKGSRDFPERVVHLATPPRVPPAWCPDQLVPRVSRAVRLTVWTGFLGEPLELRRYLGADGVGICRRSASSDPREDTLLFSKKNTRTDNRNPDLSLSETKRPSLTP